MFFNLQQHDVYTCIAYITWLTYILVIHQHFFCQLNISTLYQAYRAHQISFTILQASQHTLSACTEPNWLSAQRILLPKIVTYSLLLPGAMWHRSGYCNLLQCTHTYSWQQYHFAMITSLWQTIFNDILLYNKKSWFIRCISLLKMEVVPFTETLTIVEYFDLK